MLSKSLFLYQYLIFSSSTCTILHCTKLEWLSWKQDRGGFSEVRSCCHSDLYNSFIYFMIWLSLITPAMRSKEAMLEYFNMYLQIHQYMIITYIYNIVKAYVTVKQLIFMCINMLNDSSNISKLCRPKQTVSSTLISIVFTFITQKWNIFGDVPERF